MNKCEEKQFDSFLIGFLVGGIVGITILNLVQSGII